MRHQKRNSFSLLVKLITLIWSSKQGRLFAGIITGFLLVVGLKFFGAFINELSTSTVEIQADSIAFQSPTQTLLSDQVPPSGDFRVTGAGLDETPYTFVIDDSYRTAFGLQRTQRFTRVASAKRSAIKSNAYVCITAAGSGWNFPILGKHNPKLLDAKVCPSTK
jgi:hypothetical protein